MPNHVAPQMRTVEEVIGLTRVSRGTITNRLKAWESAVSRGETPPPGALRSVRWCGKRLIADMWLLESLGIDAQGDRQTPPPVRKYKPRGRPFQPRKAGAE